MTATSQIRTPSQALPRARRRALSGVVAITLASAAMGLLPGGTAQAQPAFPSRPITLIVPAAPGGILDQAARMVAAELTKLVNQPVVVENKAGAS
ncbi:MAG: hypothetical protein NTV19_05045, partial [Burkholderiales bacterium]|nr:hypothetical protein [Burkholderiales bacterium]